LKTSKKKKVIAIFGSVGILTLGISLMIIIKYQYHTNQLIIADCFENYGNQTTVTIKKHVIGSAVTCKRNEYDFNPYFIRFEATWNAFHVYSQS